MKHAKQQFRTHRIAVIAVASLAFAAGITSLAEPGFAKRIVNGAWQNTSSTFASAFHTPTVQQSGRLALAAANQQGVVKGATTDGQVSFNPQPLTIPAGQTTGTINVTTYANPALSYDLHFTATGTIDGAEITKEYGTTVKLLTTAACEILDTPGPPDACNDSSCYDGNGQLRCPLQSGCYTDLPACQNFKVLKVRKDRQCNQWLDCKSPVTVVNSATGRNQTQCSALGVCVQLGPDGRCSQFLSGTPSDQEPANRVFQTPEDVDTVDTESKIRWYSGYSTGFHFFTDPDNLSERPSITGGYASTDVAEAGMAGGMPGDLVKNGNFEELRCLGGPRDRKSCIVTSDCRVGTGVCAQNDEATDTDPGVTSAFSCERNTDCQGQKVGGIEVKFCHYLTAWGTDVLCKNPLDSQWVGITPPSLWCSGDHAKSCATDQDCTGKGTCIPATSLDDIEEAGWGYKATNDGSYNRAVYDGIRQGEIPQGQTSNPTLAHWRVWEDETNFGPPPKDSNGDPLPADPRHPQFGSELDILNTHLRDGNNVLKVEIKGGAKAGTGIGVPLAVAPMKGGAGYTLSLKYKFLTSDAAPTPIKAQFGLNYQQRTSALGSTKGYEVTAGNALSVDIGTIAGQNVCSLDSSKTCVADSDCSAQGAGSCLATAQWQTLTYGPVVIPASTAPAYDLTKTAFLNFVAAVDTTAPMTFYLDDVSLKPALAVAKQDTPGTGTVLKAPGCRLFARDDSPDCQYTSEDGSVYKGWRGYCLDKDPNNADLCLTWWPLDILGGERPLGASTQSNYNGASTVYQCLEQQTGAVVLDNIIETGTIGDSWQFSWDPRLSISGTGRCERAPGTPCTTDAGCNLDLSYGLCKPYTPKTGTVHWRDIERIDVLASFIDYERTGKEDSWGKGCDNPVTGGSEVSCVTDGDKNGAKLISVDPAKINRISGDEGLRVFLTQFGVNGDPDSLSWSTLYSDDTDCDGDGILGNDDQWFALRFHFTQETKPDDADAVIDKIDIKLCDDREQSLWDAVIRIIVRARSSCNYVAQTVKTDADNDGVPEQKAWGQRMKAGAYTDPKTSITYDSDSAPYGAMNAPGGDPNSWIWTATNGFGGQPSVSEANSVDSYSNLRAGTPQSFSQQPSTTTSKYCFRSDLPADAVLFDKIAELDLKTGNACDTQDAKNACLSTASDACVGRPVQHCSGNQLYACAKNEDCISRGYGSCVGSKDAGWAAGVQGAADAVKRLQHVFAQSWGCWKLESKLLGNSDNADYTSSPSTCSSKGGCYVKSTYSGSCSELNQTNSRSEKGKWDVADDRPCPGNERPSNDDNEYCYVKPEISNFLIGGASSGNITVDQNKSVTAQFSYTVDPQQAPAKQYAMEWERPSDDDPNSDCSGWSDMPVGSTIVLPGFHYTNPGMFKPRICIKDSWGVEAKADYNGTITATGS